MRCIDSMALLIEAGSALSSPKWVGGPYWIFSALEEILDLVLHLHGVRFDPAWTTIKQRQLKPKAIALQKLSKGQFEALGVPSDGILEGSLLYSLVQILDEHKIAIPQELNPPNL